MVAKVILSLMIAIQRLVYSKLCQRYHGLRYAMKYNSLSIIHHQHLMAVGKRFSIAKQGFEIKDG